MKCDVIIPDHHIACSTLSNILLFAFSSARSRPFFGTGCIMSPSSHSPARIFLRRDFLFGRTASTTQVPPADHDPVRASTRAHLHDERCDAVELAVREELPLEVAVEEDLVEPGISQAPDIKMTWCPRSNASLI